MDPPAYTRRSSTGGLKNEMKSWSRNKMEERRLAFETRKVEKLVDNQRRSLKHDRDIVCRELEQRISKKTPSIDEHLGKSLGRYAQWQEREKYRIFRRFKDLQRSYDRDFAMLDLNENDPLHGVRQAIIRDKTLSAEVLKPKTRDPGKRKKKVELPVILTEEDSDEEWERMLQRKETARRPKVKIKSTEDEMIEMFAKKSLR